MSNRPRNTGRTEEAITNTIQLALSGKDVLFVCNDSNRAKNDIWPRLLKKLTHGVGFTSNPAEMKIRVSGKGFIRVITKSYPALSFVLDSVKGHDGPVIVDHFVFDCLKFGND